MTFAPRVHAALLTVVLSSTVLGTQALADGPPSHRPGPLAGRSDVAAMVDLETKMADSLHAGHAVPIEFGSPARTPGDVVGTSGWGDSGLWTGVYLGGESFRYAVAKAQLAEGGDHDDHDDQDDHDKGQGKGNEGEQDDGFWRTQRDQALGRVTAMLAAQHRDISIAEDWTGSLRVPPAVNTANPTGTHAADFGGGVVAGERGMIMRACTPVGLGRLGVADPTQDAANPVNNNSNRVFRITWAHGDGRTYNCETSPSRDTYAGLTFGLLTAYDLVGPDRPALRAQIRADLLAMGEFLLKYGWSYPRPHGYVSAKHDFDGFISPLFVQVPMARLNLTNAVRHVLADGGAAPDRQKWDAVWAEELASQGPALAPSLEIDSAQPNAGYYKFNLHHLTGFNLLRTTSGAERDLFARAFAVMDKTTRDDVNAHFEAITYALTGDRPRLDATVTHLRQWLTYRTTVQTGAPVRNSPRCGPALACVRDDQYEIAVEQAPGGSVTWFPGAPAVPPVSQATGLRAARPLPVAVRPPSDFLWQRPPTALDGGQGPAAREPGIDFLTPYWMTRYYTEVAPPAARPLPEWAGPAHL
ncbi:MAG: hypothetical protein JWN87_2203 [Frankiales bacterium]|nr:hypothetical protein [Frankiales bacterium]